MRQLLLPNDVSMVVQVSTWVAMALGVAAVVTVAYPRIKRRSSSSASPRINRRSSSSASPRINRRSSSSKGTRPAGAVRGVAGVRPANGKAEASLWTGVTGAVLGLIPLFVIIALVLGLLGVILGFVGRGNARSGAAGGGMALAGIILGFVAIGLSILWIIYLANNPTLWA